MTTANHTLSTEILGKLLGREKIAEAQNKTYKEALDHVYSTIAKLPQDQLGTKVYMETASKGLAQYGNSYNKDVRHPQKYQSSKSCRKLSSALHGSRQGVCDFSKSESYFHRRKYLAQ